MRKAIKKIVALGVGTTMLGATMFGALAANLSDWPQPFVTDGLADFVIVLGEFAAVSDVIGAIDIATSLQTESVTETVVGGGSTVTAVGDAVQIISGSDLLELNEPISDIKKVLTENDMDMLKSGTVTTDEGTTKYRQYLRFNDSSVTITPPRVVYDSNGARDAEVGDFLYLEESTTPFFMYELTFDEGLETELKVRNNKLTLADIEDVTLNILGVDYDIVKAELSGTDNTTLTLDLIGGQVTDTLSNGDTKTYTINGVDYEVTVLFISNAAPESALLSVNGEVTDELEDGDTDTLRDGTEIGITEILTNNNGGVIQFYLGANKLELKDTNINTTGFSSGTVTVGEEKIEDANVEIKAAAIEGSAPFDSSDVIEIQSIKYTLEPDATSANGLSDIYVPPGHGIKEFLDEPQGMIGDWDITYEGLMDTGSTPIMIESSGNDEYRLTFTNVKGIEYTIPLADVKGTGASDYFAYGEDDDRLVWIEPTNFTGNAAALFGNVSDTNPTGIIQDDDYFIVSSMDTGWDKTADTRVLRYDSIDTSEQVVSFEDLATGTIEATYTNASSPTGVIGQGTLVVGDGSYDFYVANSTYNNYIAMDLNGDGDIDGDEVRITLKGGAILDLGTTLDADAANAFPMQLAINSSEFDEQNGAEIVQWNITEVQAGSDIGMSNSGQFKKCHASTCTLTSFSLNNPDSDDEHYFGATDYGAIFDLYDPTDSDTPNELTIDFPLSQRGANVFVTGGVTQFVESGEGGVSEHVNPIGVGAAILDKDAGALGTENFIVVGGPCANSLAAQLMGNPEDCAAGFTEGKAIVKLFEHGTKVSMLVAGYSALDTQAASRAVATGAIKEVEGDEAEITVTDVENYVVSGATQ